MTPLSTKLPTTAHTNEAQSTTSAPAGRPPLASVSIHDRVNQTTAGIAFNQCPGKHVAPRGSGPFKETTCTSNERKLPFLGRAVQGLERLGAPGTPATAELMAHRRATQSSVGEAAPAAAALPARRRARAPSIDERAPVAMPLTVSAPRFSAEALLMIGDYQNGLANQKLLGEDIVILRKEYSDRKAVKAAKKMFKSVVLDPMHEEMKYNPLQTLTLQSGKDNYQVGVRVNAIQMTKSYGLHFDQTLREMQFGKFTGPVIMPYREEKSLAPPSSTGLESITEEDGVEE